MKSKYQDGLFEKIQNERSGFEEFLMTMPSEEVLKRSYEYWVKGHIAETMNKIELDDASCKKLLCEEKPLEKIFSEYASFGLDDNEFIHDVIVFAAGGDPDHG